LAIQERAVGVGSPELVGRLTALATVHVLKGKYDKAESLFKRALSIQENALGRDHPDLVLTLKSYAELMAMMKRGSEADQLRERAAEIQGAQRRPGE
jgi:hypothetical protein